MKTDYQIPDIESSRSLDWLDITYPLTDIKDPLASLPQHIIWQNAEPIRGSLNNYSRMMQTEHGGKIAYSPKFPEWGVFVQFTGEPLRRLRSTGLSDDAILSLATAVPVQNIPRVDIALDWFRAGLPQDFLAHRGGKVQTRMKLDGLYLDNVGEAERGMTVYWGSKKSDRRVKVYDKGAEMNMLWQAWTRVEMMCRNKPARVAVATMKVHKVIPSIAPLLQRYFKANVEWYNQACGDDVTLGDVPPLPIVEKDPFAWYQSLLTVMKTRYHTDDEGEQVALIRRFSHELYLLSRQEPYMLQKQRGDAFTGS